MKQHLAFMAFLVLAALAAVFFRAPLKGPANTTGAASSTSPFNALPPPSVSAVLVVPDRTAPVGWVGFLSLNQGEPLNRGAAAMANHILELNKEQQL
jgi:hypothetical protein